MACFPVLFAPGWIWLMDRNDQGRPDRAHDPCTHVLIRLKSDPAKAASEILPDGSYPAEISGDSVTVKVRVIVYWVSVKARRSRSVLPRHRPHGLGDYPAPELAAL